MPESDLKSKWVDIPAATSVSGDAAMPDVRVRLPRFMGTEGDLAVMLAATKIAILGTGSVGMTIAFHLARLGVGRLWAVDPGVLKPESLLTHPVFDPEAVGQSKSMHAARICRKLNAKAEIHARCDTVQALEWTDLMEADLFVLATDNAPAEIATAQLATHLGVPLIHASLHGETMTARIAFYSNRDSSGPCLACAFTEEDWRIHDEQTRFSCDGSSRALVAGPGDAQPTISTSALCSTAADLAIHQAMRFRLHIGAPVVDTEWLYCGVNHKAEVIALRRNMACRLDHTVFRRVTLQAGLPTQSLGTLLHHAGLSGANDSLYCEVQGHQWVSQMRCDCQQGRPVGRFHKTKRLAPVPCERCGGLLHISPLDRYSRFSPAMLSSALSAPLQTLGVERACWLLFRTNETAVLLTQGSQHSSQS